MASSILDYFFGLLLLGSALEGFTLQPVIKLSKPDSYITINSANPEMMH